MLSREAYAIIVILIAVIGGYLFFTYVALPTCQDVRECDFRGCPEGMYRDCVDGRCVCVPEDYVPDDV